MALNKLTSLEMLRALAALLVVFYHTQTIFAQNTGLVFFDGVFSAGHRGVDLFFVLSGIIIAYVHRGDVNKPARLGNFVFNRVTRIYPAVWVMTAFAIFLYAAGFGGVEKTSKLALEAILASALLLPQHGDALVNVTWTLKIEMFFYVMFGVMIMNRSLGLGLLWLWQGATLAAALLNAKLGVLAYYFHPLGLGFSVGLACAWLIQNYVARPRTCVALLTAGIACFLAGMVFDRTVLWAGVPCAFGAGAIILSLVWLEKAGMVCVPNLLMRLGGASYSIYLVHYSVISLLAAVLSRYGVPITQVLCFACAVAGVIAGVVFHLTVDRPMQSWLHQQKKVFLLQ